MVTKKDPSIDFEDIEMTSKDATLDVKDKEKGVKNSLINDDIDKDNIDKKDVAKAKKKAPAKKSPPKKKGGGGKHWPVLGPIGNLVKVTNPDKKDVIDLTFRLHKLTGAILVLCTVLVTSKQFFGENIYCMLWAEEADVDINMFESYCFMKATFTLSPTEILEDVTDKHMKAHDGVYPGDHGDDPSSVFHNYYQWVCFVLFLQAMGFYAPYMAWTRSENGRLEKLITKIDTDPLTEVPLDEQVEGLAKYLASHPGTFNNYALQFFVYGLANLANVIGQMYFMHLFLGGKFLQYGLSLLPQNSLMDQSELSQMMETVFPKVTKCTMNLFGASGKVVKESGLCTLPQNILNEKLYLFFWVWFGILALWTILYNVQKLLVLSCSCYRKALLLHSSNTVSQITVQRIINHSSYGDFILLTLIQKNIEPPQFRALLVGLGDELSSLSSAACNDDGTSPSPLHFHPYVDNTDGKMNQQRQPTQDTDDTLEEYLKPSIPRKNYGCLDGNMIVPVLPLQ